MIRLPKLQYTCEVRWLLCICGIQMWAQAHGRRDLDFEDADYKMTNHAPQFAFSIYEWPGDRRKCRGIPKLQCLCRKQIIKCMGNAQKEYQLCKSVCNY